MRLRIDDIGASTKHFNQHGKKILRYKGVPFFYFPFANIGFFKRIPPFRGWAKYDELTAQEWKKILWVCEKFATVPIVAITASWVDENSNLIPFPQKFPEEAQFLKVAAQNKQIILANHGLTHCIVGKHLPRFWRSNRETQREFWPEFDQKFHDDHILKSQKILEDFFEMPITIFVPPGNVWSFKTYQALKNTNIKTVISKNYMQDSKVLMEGIEFIDDQREFVNIHDRELKLFGEKWLTNILKK